MIVYVGYLRVSTQRQGASGLGLEAQYAALDAHATRNDGRIVDMFTEIESGQRVDRPQLRRAIQLCKLTGATLLIAKLDRLARNVAFIANLMESGIEFLATDMPHANKLTVHILAAMAEYEREVISERTKAALVAAKARGIKLGGPNRGANLRHQSPSKAAERIKEKANQRTADLAPIIDDIIQGGSKSLREIGKCLEDRGIRTPRGGSWSASQVRNVLKRVCQLNLSKQYCNPSITKAYLPCS